LKSDEKPLDTQQPSRFHQTFDKFIRPVIALKDKLQSNTSPTSRPLKMFASSYKDMLVKQN
jgi:hypothetical protein